MSKGLAIIKVECGSQFSVALSNNGSVYTWGKGDYHRLGHGVDEHVRRPKKVMTLQGKKVISISTGNKESRQYLILFSRDVLLFHIGALHCVVCTDQGEVCVFPFILRIRHYSKYSCSRMKQISLFSSRSIHGVITTKVN